MIMMYLEEEISLGPACWLWDYLRRSGIKFNYYNLDIVPIMLKKKQGKKLSIRT